MRLSPSPHREGRVRTLGVILLIGGGVQAAYGLYVLDQADATVRTVLKGD